MEAKEILASGKPKGKPVDTNTEDRIRGSVDVPLSEEGEAQAEDLGRRLAGKVDCIYTSPLQRAEDTAKQILLNNPGAELIVAPELMPWKLGGIEGQPTSKVIPKIRALIMSSPDEVPPGKHQDSTEDPESFNHFCQRVLGYLKEEFEEHEDDEVDLYVTHYRDIKLLEAWLKAGEPSNYAVDKTTMLEFTGKESPGDLFQLKDRKLVETPEVTGSGIYFVRHGKTAWNGG